MDYKKEFGRLLRKAREQRKLSRAALGVRLGVHWKTIHSWEIGRCFIEDLSIIPVLERETGLDVVQFFARVAMRDAPPRPGPIGAEAVNFTVRETEDAREEEWLAVPLVQLKRRTVENINDIPFKTVKHIMVPADWAHTKQAKNLLAFTHRDKQMEPAVPFRATVVVAAGACNEIRFRTGELVAGFIHGRGVRIRYVREEGASTSRAKQRYTLVPPEGKRGIFPIRPKKDRILGRVVGTMARLSPLSS